MNELTQKYPLNSLKLSRSSWVILVLAIIHGVGVIGLASPWEALFRLLTPLTLLGSLLAMLACHQDWRKGFVAVCITAFAVGYGMEVVGVATGWPFGEYAYGKTLGIKLLDVPLVIGVNWLMLVYATAIMMSAWQIPKWLKAIFGAALMVSLDLLIEPVAVAFDFWTWVGDEIPLQNYIGWYVIALSLHLLFQYTPFQKENRAAWGLYFIQLAFFGLLNLFVI